MMDKEKVLKMARAENKTADLVEEHIEKEAGYFANNIGVMLCALLMITQNILTGEAELSCAIVCVGMYAARMFSRYKVSKAKWSLVFAVILSAATVLGIVVHLINLLGVI